MNDNSSSDFTRFAGCGLATAAIIAAIALLIFALAFAGIIGGSAGGWGMMRQPGAMPMQGMPGAGMMHGQPAGAGTTPGSGTPGVGTPDTAPPASSPQSSAPGTSNSTAGTASTGGAFTPDAAGARSTGTRGTAASTSAAASSTAAVGVGAALVIEDWSGFADDDALVDAYSFNTAVPDNDLELQISAAAPGRPAGITAVYSITAPAPNDYVGFDRTLGTAEDWTPYTHLSVQAEPSERTARQLVVQWHEASGEVWRHRTQFADIPADGKLLIPLTADAWEWADWSDTRNQALDLDAVVHIGVYMGHDGPGAGTVKLGAIEVVREP